MKNYTVYFEIYDKKLKTIVPAVSEDMARAIVVSKLKILKVVEIPEEKNPLDDFLTNSFKNQCGENGFAKAFNEIFNGGFGMMFGGGNNFKKKS